ncbi:MAG TPA: ATP-binding protein [Terriglobia bacterium]|nr:ATP-binding protein [Terriglobia bacterium]
MENPWWEGEHAVSPFHREMRPRPYLDLFLPLVKTRSVRRAVVLMGPRRVGKTVMIYHSIQAILDEGALPKSICYFSVDHPIYNGLTLEKLLSYYSQACGAEYKSEEVYIFFDEIQYLRNWEVHLKSIVDSHPNIKCIASGSAAAALRLKSTESGAGRFTDFLLPPLTFYEYLHLLGKDGLVDEPISKGRPEPGKEAVDESATIENFSLLEEAETRFFKTKNIEELNNQFLRYLNFGGYPEVIFSAPIQADPGRFIKSDIIDKVLLRDLPSLYGISDIQELNYLFTTLAFNTANEISLGELSKNSGVAKNTLKRYIEYLEAAFLIKVVHRVDRNAKRFQRENFFKIYLTNPSMRAALFSPLGAEDEAVASLAETSIFSQWFHSDEPLYYGRWHDGEVDMVYLGPKQKAEWVVEVKWSDRYCDNPDELRSLLAFCKANQLKRPLVTSKTKTEVRNFRDIRIEFVPASIYSYTVGYNVIQGKKAFQTLALPDASGSSQP